jgi:hypothetical protein
MSLREYYKNEKINKGEKQRKPTYRQNAAAYVALIENIEFFVPSSCNMAFVKRAVASTWLGRLPLSFHTAT